MSDAADQLHKGSSGVLTEWNDERGFGFIEPAGGGPRVFVHVSAFPRGRRPVTGAELGFVESRDERGRPRASQVHYLTRGPAGRRAPGVARALVVAALFLGLVGALVAAGRVSVLVLAGYGLLSALALCLYGADKSAARNGQWRTPESTLHLVALLGGWPGALVARQAFRHKTVKQPFVTVFWVTVIVNCAALAWLVAGAPLP